MFDRVLVPLDGSSLAECVLPHVVAASRAFDAPVSLVHVLEAASTVGRAAPVDPLAWHINKAEARTYLDDVAARLQAVGLPVETSLVEGQAARSIIELAAAPGGNGRPRSDLVVLSSHGRSGLSGWNVSSVTQQIILRVRRSVLIVRAYQPAVPELEGARYRRLLVPLDCSQRAEYVLPVATALAQLHGARVLAVHALRRPELLCREPLSPEDARLSDQLLERNRREATAYLDQLRGRLPLDTETRLVSADNLVLALHDLAEQEQVDLVVMSAHGQSGTTRFPYGSLVVSFLAYGSAPLLIVQDLPPEELEPSQAEVLTSEYKGH